MLDAQVSLKDCTHLVFLFNLKKKERSLFKAVKHHIMVLYSFLRRSWETQAFNRNLSQIGLSSFVCLCLFVISLPFLHTIELITLVWSFFAFCKSIILCSLCFYMIFCHSAFQTLIHATCPSPTSPQPSCGHSEPHPNYYFHYPNNLDSRGPVLTPIISVFSLVHWSLIGK